MFMKATLGTLAYLAMATVPTIAEAQMGSGNAMMASGDHAMKPMSKSQMAMMAKCKKMSAAKMHKNKTCTKMMAMHSGM